MDAATIGIRREDVNRWERRAPLTPREVARLVRDEGLRVIVQPSDIRIFEDAAYEEAGATVSGDLGPCDVIFAVKEIPAGLILPNKIYAFFSHVIKGQPANMPMLAALRDRQCSLVDYERIVDAEGRRLVFFGRFAGLAGMIDTLWALGKRLAYEKRETPFAALKAAWQYDELEDARAAVSEAGEHIAGDGLGKDLAPLVVAFAGYGNVSLGAQEILDLLPVEEVSPAGLANLASARKRCDNVVYKVVFKEEDMVRPRARGASFDLRDYYDFPDRYEPVFSTYLPYVTVMVNCIYWDARYPRFVTKRDLAALYGGGAAPPRLRVIGDISCDVEGGVEATVKGTTPDSPVYVYDVECGRAVDGVAGNGPVILAVFNLPAELPRDASAYFGRQLEPFVAPIARAEWEVGFGDLELPPPVKAATILYRGEFTPQYRYLERYLA